MGKSRQRCAGGAFWCMFVSVPHSTIKHMFSFFKKQPAPNTEHKSFVDGTTKLFSDLTSNQKKSIFVLVMHFFPEQKHFTKQNEVPITRLAEQYELVLDSTIDDFVDSKDNKFFLDVRNLPVSQKKMVATMILGFHKFAPLPTSEMVEHFDLMERAGISLNMYNEVIRDYEIASGNIK
jgi:hypothetical protein